MGSVFTAKDGRIGVTFKGHTYWSDSQRNRFYHVDHAKKFLGYLQTKFDDNPREFDPRDYGRDPRLLIENAWELYDEQSPCDKARHDIRKGHFKNYILPTFGNKLATEIHYIDIKEWVDKISNGLEPETVRGIVHTFKAFFNFLYRVEILKDRVPGFPVVKVPTKKIKWITREDQDRVFEFIPKYHLPIFIWLRDYGRRVGEACKLKKEDIDLEKNQIHLKNTKTSRIDDLPIGEDFNKWLAGSTIATNLFYVFSDEDGRPYSRNRLWRIWGRANKKAHEKYGTPIVTPYEGTRKSFASQRMGSCDPVLIQTVLGHTNLSTTQAYYAKVDTGKLGEIVELRKKVGE